MLPDNTELTPLVNALVPVLIISVMPETPGNEIEDDPNVLDTNNAVALAPPANAEMPLPAPFAAMLPTFEIPPTIPDAPL